MADSGGSSNKAKIARRVIEVLEYFDDTHREATVMDIVRRYDRPQSSTSELLSSLVELGLLHKDPFSRSYRLTPRAALLGATGQSGMVRDGRLIGLIDRLAAQTGLSIGLFAMVGLNSQIVSWRAGSRCSAAAVRGLAGGLQQPLSDSASGWLLMSTIAQPRCDGLVRRLNAEAADDRKFAAAEMTARIDQCRALGHVHGPAGFGAAGSLVATLLPIDTADHPLAIGLLYGPEDRVNADSLLECLNEAIRQTLRPEEAGQPSVKLVSAA